LYDVIVVGARCAGSPLAMLLARAGHRVLVVDRSQFPSDTMSTHFIQAPGMVRLNRWGLLDRLRATDPPPISKAIADTDGAAVELEFPVYEGVEGLLSPRRTVLDKILVDAAAEAGAELALGVAIDELIFDGGRVAGVRGRTSEGSFEERATYVVGTDGRNSTIAQLVGAPFQRNVGNVTAGYYSYFSGTGIDATELYLREHLIAVAFPTHEGLTTIAIEWPGAKVNDLKGDIEGNFYRAMDELGTLGERVRAGKRAERFVGAHDLPNFLRLAHGPGWALAGDAAYHKDPAPADGITDAFRAADLLSTTLNEVLTGEVDEGTAFDRWQQQHDHFAVPSLELTVQMAGEGRTAPERADAFIQIRMKDAEDIASSASQNAGV
jgi:flavin-dependent dehydrogenase